MKGPSFLSSNVDQDIVECKNIIKSKSKYFVINLKT